MTQIIAAPRLCFVCTVYVAFCWLLQYTTTENHHIKLIRLFIVYYSVGGIGSFSLHIYKNW